LFEVFDTSNEIAELKNMMPHWSITIRTAAENAEHLTKRYATTLNVPLKNDANSVFVAGQKNGKLKNAHAAIAIAEF